MRINSFFNLINTSTPFSSLIKQYSFLCSVYITAICILIWLLEVTQFGDYHLLFSLFHCGQPLGLLGSGVSPLWLLRTGTCMSEALVHSRDEEMVLQLVNPVFFFRLTTSLKSPVLRGREPRSSAAWTHLGLGLILACSMEWHQHSLEACSVKIGGAVHAQRRGVGWVAADGSKLQPFVGTETHIKQ